MPGWDSERGLLEAEVTQRRDEGCEVPGWLSDAVAALPAGDDGAESERLWEALGRLEPDARLAGAEPNELAAIRALRPGGPRDLAWRPSESELVDRLHGAWTGRAVGCALGKPVETGYGMAVEAGRTVGRARIRSLLDAQGAWPLSDYFSAAAPAGHRPLSCPASTREAIAYMEADDDIHYTLIALRVLEERGPEFEWSDVAWSWSRHLPYSAIYTAETQAILNFWNRSDRLGQLRGRSGTAATPAWTRSHRNPYREWIGAQIRSDGWAWACAGKPELAAEFAHRDASWTHTRNGVYGAMFFAAVQAAAFVEPDVRRLVDIGLSEIPRECRLARWIGAVLAWRAAAPDLEAALDRMEGEPELRAMSPVHTINNAVACVLALLYAEPQIDAATCAAVMTGLDTDCNGATVGSVVGAITGREAYRGRMALRLNDTLKPAVVGFQELRMRDLAERHAAVWRRV
ncbi:MAG TPA: ADP-ribosylglycohydrolase family protein, partial [Caulobacteraceae bacterium]|nr:ADP-ribosylglycohydrolase family protein [Caulobacteraceae bacterium]